MFCPPGEDFDPLDAGVTAVVRAINEAIGDIDAAFAADLQARHDVPEWDRPAPMWPEPIDI